MSTTFFILLQLSILAYALVAGVFLGYAVVNTGRAHVTGTTLHAKFDMTQAQHGFPSGIIRQNWNDAERISVAPAPG